MHATVLSYRQRELRVTGQNQRKTKTDRATVGICHGLSDQEEAVAETSFIQTTRSQIMCKLPSMSPHVRVFRVDGSCTRMLTVYIALKFHVHKASKYFSK